MGKLVDRAQADKNIRKVSLFQLYSVWSKDDECVNIDTPVLQDKHIK